MRNSTSPLVLLSAVYFLLSTFCFASEPRQRTVSASGDADVMVMPDIITLTLGIETSSTRLAEAKQRNDTNTSAVVQAALKSGVERANVKTDYLRIEPRYRDYRELEFLGYYVQRNVVTELRNVSQFETLLSNVLEAGANYVHGIEFRTSELRKHRDKARSLAVTAAREKAEALAGQLNQQVGEPVTISESSSWWSSSYGSHWGGGSGSNVAQNVVSSAPSGGGDSGSSIEPGKIRVNARVDVTFELKSADPDTTQIAR